MYSRLVVLLVTICINAAKSNDKELGSNESEEYSMINNSRLKMAEYGELCEQNICLTKCCPLEAGYVINNKKCGNTTHTFDAVVYGDDFNESYHASDLFYFKIGMIHCERQYQASFFKQENLLVYLKKDGKIHVGTGNIPLITITPDQYCIDNFMTEIDGEIITKVDALVCYTQETNKVDYVIRATCMIISCVFIMITVGVYVWLPQLHNVHGIVLIAYLTCLFVGLLVTAIMQLQIYYSIAVYCQTMTFIIYFSLLSAFFWLNVMCFDMWRVFSGKREVRPQKSLVWSQIRKYALYAFGIPIVLTILVAALEYSGLPQGWWMPNVRTRQCFFPDYSKLIYLYGPIFTLCVANLVLFVLTAVRIAKTRKETSVLSSSESSRHDQRNDAQTLVLYVKLFCLMGINWILEVISALYPDVTIWRYTDCYNVLVGFIIFIIFVCKQQTFNLLKERYRAMRNIS